MQARESASVAPETIVEIFPCNISFKRQAYILFAGNKAMMCQKSFFKISQKMITKQGWPTSFLVPPPQKNPEYGECLVCSLIHTSHQTIQQEASILSFADPLTPLAHQRRNCNKVSQLCSVINNKGNSIRPNVMYSFNIQGHPMIVSS